MLTIVVVLIFIVAGLLILAGGLCSLYAMSLYFKIYAKYNYSKYNQYLPPIGFSAYAIIDKIKKELSIDENKEELLVKLRKAITLLYKLLAALIGIACFVVMLGYFFGEK